ncbi:MAG: sorbosone dehydrogenase family protein [Nitrospira sp.]
MSTYGVRRSRVLNHTAGTVYALLILFFFASRIEAGTLPLDTIKLPPGFTIALYTNDVPNARGMALGQAGVLFVGTRDKGDVYAVLDKDGDQRADEVLTIARGLQMPVGVAYRQGALYVSAVDRILRFDKIDARLNDVPPPVVITDRFPKETSHGWKFIAFGPDGKLYVSVGAPCNICEPDPDRYALIGRLNSDGSGFEIVARGVRNSVGFDWDPTTHDLWFTENGRDYLGDNQPPDELNHAAKTGLHFGYPYCHGTTLSDPEYGHKHPCREFRAPAAELGPHVASLGMRFYTGDLFPKEYRNHIFIAEHGSWNRSEKSGYRITMVSRDEQGHTHYSVFAEGWLQGQHAWGRPVDVLVMPDGALLVSDDVAGAIYRISYSEP